MLFRLENVSKEFGSHLVFSGVTAQANPGDRIGLIGRNGSGKTTLLDLIEGRLEPDTGRVVRPSDLQISRIRQIPEIDRGKTVREQALEVFDHFRSWERRLLDLEHGMAESGGLGPREAAEYDRLRGRLKLEGGYDYQARTEGVLLGVGFTGADLDRPCRHLSGGQISRLALARSLLEPADLMLLDEPTNHLDLEGLIWLEDYLSQLSRPFVLISHDRHFLDRVTSLTWELGNGTLWLYPCAYSPSRRLKQQRLEQQRAEYERQQEWKLKTEDFIRRNLYGQKTKQAQARRRQLAKAQWVEPPPASVHPPRLRITEAGRGGAISFAFRDATIGYPGLPLIEAVNLRVHRGDRVAVLGGNGTGKSTLLRSLQRKLPLLGGQLEWGPNVAAAYFSQDPDLGDEQRTVYDALRELDGASSDGELRSYAARFLFREEEVFKPIRKLSGGERSRLALARLFYFPCNLLVMDEPTNHLDIESREALEAALLEFEGSLVIVSHDLYFLERVVRDIHLIRDRRLIQVPSLSELPDLLLRQRRPEVLPRSHRPRRSRRVSVGLSKNERRRRQLRLNELEQEIARLEKQRKQALTSIEEGGDYTELQRHSARAEQISNQLEELYQQWETLAAELSEEQPPAP